VARHLKILPAVLQTVRILVFTKHTDSYLHIHVGLCAVDFNNIIIYMYTCVSQVAPVYRVKITVRGLMTPATVDMTY